MHEQKSSSAAGSATSTEASPTPTTPATPKAANTTDGTTGVAEQLANRIFNPRGLVVLTRERIQDVLDDAAERGRMTRSDANELVSELVRKGRQQTDDVLTEIDKLVGRGRGQFESATRKARQSEPVDRLVRTADRARRSVGVGPTFPIPSYDELTAGQVIDRLEGLQPPQLRKVRDYERRHANRKSVLDAVEKQLG